MNRKPVPAAGWSAVQCITTNTARERVVPPHPPAASFIPRPSTPDAIVETSSSKNSQGHNGSDIDLTPKTIKAGPHSACAAVKR
jgi:hypothetical protein